MAIRGFAGRTASLCVAAAVGVALVLGAAADAASGVDPVAGGTVHSIALRYGGTAWAWGANWDGQLGDGTTTDHHVPAHVQGPGGAGFLTGVEGVAAAGSHSLGREVHQVELPAGSSAHEWNLADPGGQRVAAGLYLYRVVLQDGSRLSQGRLVVLP
ncbi:RCC1 domain-containing protein [Limnochorda pilosa]|uniref:FlgD Ig-like domain-containing protein n=1 Tax=Limnochorda pilosa TaxID=1555112 RepID=A0A0K2SIQ3_LIMPI|nr:RCC1 domain-containing protein [Limnochorda pilosa]BAS26699.1 hypothetical protein LIP_0842 [Limnochorda pilosa]